MTADHIISAAADYAPQLLRPFLESLCRVGFHGTLHLLVTQRNADSMRSATSSMPYKCQSHLLRRPRSANENRLFRLVQHLPLTVTFVTNNSRLAWGRRFILDKALPISSLRYLAAAAIVNALSADSTILLTDSRDVYFQSNPFEEYRCRCSGALALAMETHQIEEGNITHSWLRELYGASVASPLRGKAVVCSGTTLGTREVILQYLRLMCEQIVDLRTRLSHTNGFDQGIHNYLFYHGLLPGALAPENGKGVFLTVQTKPPLDREGLVRRPDGSIIPLVHQYDRAIVHFQQSKYFRALTAGIPKVVAPVS